MRQSDNKASGPQLEVVKTLDGKPIGKSSAGKSMKASTGDSKNYKSDKYIWGIYLCFLVYSVIELFSASSTEVTAGNIYAPLIRHCIFLALGLGIIILLQKTHYGYFGRLAWPIAILSLGLVLLASFMGVSINGASRAIRIAGMTIQPPEIAKLSIIILLSYILGKNQRPGGVSNKGIVLSALVVIAFAAILWINGLTNTILVMGVSVAMFLIGGIQWSKIVAIIIIYGVAAGGVYLMKSISSSSSEYDQVETTLSEKSANPNMKEQQAGSIGRTSTHINRFSRWLRGVKPQDPIDDINRQEILAKFAIANGGISGKGPGNSRESARLPLAFSDYIYSIVVEETGLVGGIILIGLYLCLLGRAGRIAYQCTRAFPAFLIMGCAVLIVFQALVHMAIVTGVGPVSGQPLPFISKGGTSVLVMSAAIGIMLSVSRFAVRSKDSKEMRAEKNNLPEELQALNITGYQNNDEK